MRLEIGEEFCYKSGSRLTLDPQFQQSLSVK